MPITTDRYWVGLNRLHQFFANVEFTPTCWNWTGGMNQDGYAMFKHTTAYRYTYWWMVGPIPDDLEIDHRCRNRACVNPAHLEAVTAKENIHRSIEARRGGRPASMEAYAAHLGINVRRLYRIFDPKHQIIPALAAQLSERTGITIEQFASGQGPALLRERLAEFVDTDTKQTTHYFHVPGGRLEIETAADDRAVSSQRSFEGV